MPGTIRVAEDDPEARELLKNVNLIGTVLNKGEERHKYY